jgi:hypothetical protein
MVAIVSRFMDIFSAGIQKIFENNCKVAKGLVKQKKLGPTDQSRLRYLRHIIYHMQEKYLPDDQRKDDLIKGIDSRLKNCGYAF